MEKLKNKKFKLMFFIIFGVVLFLVINYFIYDVSRAADTKTIFEDYSEEGIANFNSFYWDESIELGAGNYAKQTNKLSSKLKCKDENNSYQISNIYLTVSGNKITVHYDSNYKYIGEWYNAASYNDYNNAKYKYQFSIRFWNPGNSASPIGGTYYVLTEWRRDAKSGSNDHETFDFCGDDFNKKDAYSDIVSRFSQTNNNGQDWTIEQLIADGRLTISLSEVDMNIH